MEIGSRSKRGSGTYGVLQWRKVLDGLSQETGVSFKDVTEYIGSVYNEEGVSFYLKIPRKRRNIIGIGMAFGQPLEVINEWIAGFGKKKKLYVKDISEDLIWIYLIRAAEKDRSREKNYFALYEKCQETAYATYRELWDELTIGSRQTADVEILLEKVDYDDDFAGLKEFIIDNLDSFKTAYTKPRKYLDKCLGAITCVLGDDGEAGSHMNSLRGFLDDSMINYLSGDSATINVIDTASKKRTLKIKYVPKNKKTHIALGLALGMSRKELDQYLELMGYFPLSEEIKVEKQLLKALSVWEQQHPIQRRFKRAVLEEDPSVQISIEDKRRAVREMLVLRQELRAYYWSRGWDFPYWTK